MNYISDDVLTLVGFHATWCYSCKAMRRILSEFKEQAGNDVRVLKIDIDAPSNSATTNEFNVESVPTLIFFRRGEILWQNNGTSSVEELIEMSDKLLEAV